jgi:hypothetical protein
MLKWLVLPSIVLLAAAPIEAQTLRGSPASMQKQNRVAHQHSYSFLQTGGDVRRFVDGGYLVPLRGSADYTLASVSYPYARPAVKVFVERLAAQYHAACGERLVVTSLTRPAREQPRNASSLSVHPAGMAVDFRISERRACRAWLEENLLVMERRGVLDATRETTPPHYHVALYPDPYIRYVAARTHQTPAAVLASAGGRDARGAARYTVRPGDSLWSIARLYGTSVENLRVLNGLSGTTVRSGQSLRVPDSRMADAGGN